MRTDVKIGIAIGAGVLLIAVAYYGAKRNDNIAMADAPQKSDALGELLGHAQADNSKKPDAPKEKRSPTLRGNSHQAAANSAKSPARRTNDGRSTNQNRGTQQPRRNVAKTTRTDKKNDSKRPQNNAQPRTAQGKGRKVPEDFKPSTPSSRAAARQANRYDLPNRPQRAGGQTAKPVPGAASSNVPTPESLGRVGPPKRNTATDAAAARKNAGRTPQPRTSQAQPGTAGARSQSQPNGVPTSTSPPRSASPAGTRVHEVKSGDTFSAIAIQYLGSERHTWRVLDANPGVDPRRLQVGTKLVIPTVTTQTRQQPARVEPKPKRPRGTKTYTVRSGDSFYEIAASQLGSGSRWREIYELNKSAVGSDPNRLKVGLELVLPKR